MWTKRYYWQVFTRDLNDLMAQGRGICIAAHRWKWQAKKDIKRRGHQPRRIYWIQRGTYVDS